MFTPHTVWTAQRISWWEEQQQKGKRNFILLRGIRIGTILLLTPAIVLFYIDPAFPQFVLFLSIFVLLFYTMGFIAASYHWNQFETSYQYHQEMTNKKNTNLSI